MKTNLKFILIAAAVFLSGNMEAQQSQIDSLKTALAISKADTVRINLLNKIADKFKESHPDSTFLYATKAAHISKKTGFKLGAANSHINLGNSQIILGNYKKALQYFIAAETGYAALLKANPRDVNLKNGLARAYASAGVVYSEESNYYEALEKYQKALKLYQETGQKSNISKAYNNIGIVYKSQQNYPKALEYLNKAYQSQSEIGEPSAAVTLTNIGVIYFETGKSDLAIKHYNQAEKLFQNNGNKRGLALLNNYLGDYYRSQNDSNLSEQYYVKSLQMYEEMQNKFGASLALYNLGKWHLGLKQYTDAMTQAQKSLAYAREIGVLDQIYHSEKLVSDLYGLMGNPELSLTHYKNYITARDSIANQENNKKFALAEMNFEYQKKEALLIEKNKRHTQLTIFSALGAILLIGLLLVLYNRMQVKRRLTLQKEVAEYEQKALHLQMNPHFVFNCLGSISSFIVQNGTDSALKYLSKFSKLMRLTLEYSKDSLIPIDKEIESLQNYLELEQLRFHNKFEFTISASDKVEFNMGLPPLLIQPFVENAILHGVVPKEGEGKIEVRFDVVDRQLVCTITDNGIGLSKSAELKESSVAAHKSMALEITKKRLEIMESTTSKSAQIKITELENGAGKSGTKVTLQLPIQYIP